VLPSGFILNIENLRDRQYRESDTRRHYGSDARSESFVSHNGDFISVRLMISSEVKPCLSDVPVFSSTSVSSKLCQIGPGSFTGVALSPVAAP
jgi:hypothetical protein